MAYTTLTDLVVNTELTAGTYYLENNVNLNSFTLTLNCIFGPIIIKRNGDVYFTNVGVVDTLSSGYNDSKVYWTVKDDDTVGEIIDGSTGSPSASGGSFNNEVAANSVSLNFVYWELRWCARPFLNCANTVGFKFYNIIVRNCSLSSGSFIQNQVYSGNNQIFDTIYIDNTNTFSGNSRILSILYNGTASYVTKIKSEAHVTSSNCPISLGDWQTSAKKSFSYIYCLNESGVSALEISRSPLISNCYLEGGLTLNPNTVTPTIKNCILFKGNSINTKGITIRGTGASFLGASRIINNIITGFTRGAIDVITSHGSNSHTIIEFRDNIITNNTYVLYWTNFNTAANITASGWSNNVFYNNTNFGGGYANWNTWTQQATDFTADPQFQNAPTGCVIDTEFAKYIPDGYFVGNIADIAEKGSDTFNNLGINEDENTATGYWYPNGKTQKVTPGINYLVDSFASTPISQVQLSVNLTEGQIGQIIPLTDNSYLVSSFSMIGTKENLASLRSLTSGQQVTLDLTSVGNQTLNHCSFKDIKCINGTISVLNGKDLGNNEGITFTTAAEDLAISVTAGNIQEILLDEFAYNVTSFSMQGQNGNLAYLRSKTLNSPVTLDLTTVGSQTLTHCSFRDIHVTNGTITVTDGLDLGGNSGITFNTSEIPSDIEINVNENETQILFPKLEPYNVTSFNMIGSNGRPATLKSSVEGTPVILDMSSFPISNLEYCDFQDVELLNGTIVSTNGKDLGGNTGITFQQTEIPEDCVDWKITEELINQLSTMSTGYNTQVKTVQLIESEFKSPDSFPVLIVCPNEIDPDQEYASRNDTLPFALIYIDDSVETNLHYRFRNVPADVQKCLKKNETLNYLAHYVKVDNWENSVFEVGGIEFACCIIYVSVERKLDASDPYRLA